MAFGRGRWMVGAALALGLAGCDGTPMVTPDGGPVVTDGGSVPQLDPLAAWEEQGSGDDAMFVTRALDYACRGARTRPTPGAPVTTTFQLRDFEDDFEVDDAEVWVFNDNVIADDCSNAATCTAITTDGSGNASLMLPAGGWYAYRVIPKPGFNPMLTVFGVFQYNEPAPLVDGEAVTGNSVSGSTIEVIPATLGITRSEGLAIVAGRIEDCAGGFVENAIIRLYDPNGDPVVAQPSGPFFHYFNGDAAHNVPAQAETDSNADGLYVLAELPVVSDGPYRIEAWGNLDGELRILGCESARIFEDSVTILNLGPIREDAPAGCPPAQ